MKSAIHIRASSTPGIIDISSTPAWSPALEDVFFVLSAADAPEVRRKPGNVVQVPDTLLVQRLSELRRLQLRCGFSLEVDETSEDLIRRFLREAADLARVRGQLDVVPSPEDVQRRLQAVAFKRMLTSEQLRDAARLLTLRNGANFSVPGAGKTTTLLAVHELVRANAEPSLRLLVVAPRNAFIAWDEEIAACLGRDATMLRLTGGRQRIALELRSEPDIAAITYQQLPLVLSEVMAFARRNRVHIVLDESHRIKGGRAGIQGAAVLSISPLAARRDILSGTPMPQGLSDLASQFDFLWPGHSVVPLGSMASCDSDAQIRSASEALSPFFVRTKKSELGLAPPIRTLVPVQLGQHQRALYELMRSEAARLTSGLHRADRSKLRVLGKQVVRLIQAASNPQLLLAGLERGSGVLGNDQELIFLLRSMLRDEPSAKLNELSVLVPQILADREAKVVIWSSFVANVEYLVQVFRDQGAVGIHGAVPTGDEEDMAFREARIRRFNHEPTCRVMVANPAACGEGISLHRACHNAVYLDRSYNAAHYLQSVDRIHRLGVPADTVTNVYLLVAENTIDESLEGRVGQKIAAMGAVLDDKQLRALAYDPADVVDDYPGGISSDDVDSIVSHLCDGERDGE